MYSLIRPILFRLDPETAHQLTLKALHWLPAACFRTPMQKTPVSALGMEFPHAVGLAAGLDKNGEHLDALARLGFGFIEVGTVTPKPQTGNPCPRLFRLPKAQALINRMGFNNHGVETLVANVQRSRYRGILGINIGKNKDTPLAQAVEDYRYCLTRVYALASYVTINVSSPNTPGLRQLQEEDYLNLLLEQLREEQKRLEDQYQRHVPLLVKLSPDEPNEALKRMAEVALRHQFAGIIATNTTCSRTGVKTLPLAEEAGGLSGEPLFERAHASLSILKQIVGSDAVLIASGGIHDALSARRMLDAGASLLQIYTGLIYQGPGLVPLLAESLCNA